MSESPAAVTLPFSAHGVYLREWRLDDIRQMRALFDTDQMNRWTPLPHPFTLEVAKGYVAQAHDGRAGGTLQLAICEDVDGPPLGEVIVFPGHEADEVELAYAVGEDHQRRGIATRAVLAALELAQSGGARRASLTIAAGSTASEGVAAAAGFAVTDAPRRERRRKGFVLQMRTWTRVL